jgi:hypothetical protein
MLSVVRITAAGKVKELGNPEAAAHVDFTGLDAMLPVVQALIPLGLQAFAEVMQAEVAHFAGPRYGRAGGQPGVVRWSRQRGSIFLADQKVYGDCLGRCPHRREGPPRLRADRDGE